VDWFYNDLQERGDRQNTRKLHKTSLFVGWIVGWEKICGNPPFTPRKVFIREDHSVAAVWKTVAKNIRPDLPEI
jgi:hypothetical protein